MCLRPQSLRDRQGIEIVFCPPIALVPEPVNLPMVATAERHRELIAHLASKRPRLRKPKMVRIGRLTPTKETGLRGDELQVSLVAIAARLTDREHALVNATHRCVVGQVGGVFRHSVARGCRARAWDARNSGCRHWLCNWSQRTLVH